MLDFLIGFVAHWIISLRYRIKVRGLEKIRQKGTEGVLLLPNHPGLIDPVIVFAWLFRPFHPRALGDRDQLDRFVIRRFAKWCGIRTIPSINIYGSSARDRVEAALQDSIEGINNGENLLLWPAGHLQRNPTTRVGGNSGVELICQKCPDVRIVMVRIKGLWGSKFSWASGKEPKVAPILLNGIWQILLSGIFFMPKREVEIELVEPDDFPKDADRFEINRYLEDFYNADYSPNTFVPYTIWDRSGRQILPEPQTAHLEGDSDEVPEQTRQMVEDYLRELSGSKSITDSDHLGRDLGLDSLARTDIVLWLEKEFGFTGADVEALQTVKDVLLAACGQFFYVGKPMSRPVSPKWFKTFGDDRIHPAEGDTLTAVFLQQAARHPAKIAIADQTSGERSYRDLIIGCKILSPKLRALQGDYMGIMLPASVAATTVYMATLFSDKTPVMVNWTVGQRNIQKPLESLGVKYILTSKVFVERLRSQGTQFGPVEDLFLYLEDFAGQISKFQKLWAWLWSHISWSDLRKAKPGETAAILFTSGSETVPKAVPLTHKNILSNIDAVLKAVAIYRNDRMIGILPPFHSFGLTGTVLLPLCAGASVVYHPNPVEAGLLGQLIDAYEVTALIGTPTFLNGIMRASTSEQLETLRFAVTGAEKCSEKVYETMREKCANAVVMEGYGVTECSPIITVNDENDPKPFTIGKLLPGFDYRLLDPQTKEPTEGKGILLVRGPSVFGGYLNYEGQSPFIELQGQSWYSTGDIVRVDDEGVFTFEGRLKRFVKMGGEMISLPAIEAVLAEKFAGPDDEGPILAVEATDEPVEIVLFATIDLDREKANTCIRESGLSGLYNIRKVIKIDEIPLLGTGKIDYRKLKSML